MYIKREEEAPKTVPSKYTGSIQKPAKVALQGGKERNTPPSLTYSLTNLKNLQEKKGAQNYRHPNPRPKIIYKRIFQYLKRKLLIPKS